MKKKENKLTIDRIIIIVLLIVVILLVILNIVIITNNRKDNSNVNNYNNEEINNNDKIDNNISNNVKLTKEEALDIALKNLNVKKSEIFDLDIELENKYGSIVYEVSFKNNIHEYEYYIDAESGKIIHSFKELDF